MPDTLEELSKNFREHASNESVFQEKTTIQLTLINEKLQNHCEHTKELLDRFGNIIEGPNGAPGLVTDVHVLKEDKKNNIKWKVGGIGVGITVIGILLERFI